MIKKGKLYSIYLVISTVTQKAHSVVRKWNLRNSVLTHARTSVPNLSRDGRRNSKRALSLGPTGGTTEA